MQHMLPRIELSHNDGFPALLGGVCECVAYQGFN